MLPVGQVSCLHNPLKCPKQPQASYTDSSKQQQPPKHATCLNMLAAMSETDTVRLGIAYLSDFVGSTHVLLLGTASILSITVASLIVTTNGRSLATDLHLIRVDGHELALNILSSSAGTVGQTGGTSVVGIGAVVVLLVGGDHVRTTGGGDHGLVGVGDGIRCGRLNLSASGIILAIVHQQLTVALTFKQAEDNADAEEE